jgi:hypothetical protein
MSATDCHATIHAETLVQLPGSAFKIGLCLFFEKTWDLENLQTYDASVDVTADQSILSGVFECMMQGDVPLQI